MMGTELLPRWALIDFVLTRPLLTLHNLYLCDAYSGVCRVFENDVALMLQDVLLKYRDVRVFEHIVPANSSVSNVLSNLIPLTRELRVMLGYERSPMNFIPLGDSSFISLGISTHVDPISSGVPP